LTITRLQIIQAPQYWAVGVQKFINWSIIGVNDLKRALSHRCINQINHRAPDPMFDYLLESSHRDDSYQWSSIGFGEDITQVVSSNFKLKLISCWAVGVQKFINWCIIGVNDLKQTLSHSYINKINRAPDKVCIFISILLVLNQILCLLKCGALTRVKFKMQRSFGQNYLEYTDVNLKIHVAAPLFL